jgi:hypothetical protein
MRPAEFAGKTALYGVGGWAIENMIFGPRFSVVFGRAPVPFLPVYAAGGAALMLTRPHLRRVPWLLRVPVYAAMLSGIEYVGCLVDRKLFGACSWDYSGQDCAQTYRGCIDLQHSLVWGALGLLAEGLSWLSRSSATALARRRRRSRARSTSGSMGAWPRNVARPANRAALAASVPTQHLRRWRNFRI